MDSMIIPAASTLAMIQHFALQTMWERKYVVCLIGYVFAVAAAQVPASIESVEYDSSNSRFFVSNRASILETSNLGMDFGSFGEARATHGMEVVDNMLVVIDNNVIRAYSLADATALGELAIDGVGFLNGMGSRPGEVVVTDFEASRLFRVNISNPADMTYKVLVSDTGTTPNGVVLDEDRNRALVVNWGGDAPILAIDLSTG